MFSEFRTLNVATIRATRRVAAEIRELRNSARLDPRTGLMNERAMDEHLIKVLEKSSFANLSSLFLIDIRMMTGPQDTIGSSLPNQALELVSRRLQGFAETICNERGFAANAVQLGVFNGGQIALCIEKVGTRDDVSAIIRVLQNELRQPLQIDNKNIMLAFAGCIVIIPEDADSVAQIRQRALATINDLKAQDKQGFAFYSPRLERQREARVKLEGELREAVAQDRFVPLFQPKIDLMTGMICGAEALARWRLESGRLVAPSVFIDLAEQTGLINQIGEQIMRKACHEAAQWTQRGHRLNLAVNVSPRQFERDGLTQMILDSLARSGLAPRQLEIEITESLAIQQPERVRFVLNPLRRLGIKLAVDDFGTGHSNLAVLGQFDFDVFKIDRQFVSNTPGDAQANAIVEMIMSMASTLDMQIVGEGIETEEQAQFLKSKGCHIGQGYLYSPPVTGDAFLKLLTEQPFARVRQRA